MRTRILTILFVCCALAVAAAQAPSGRGPDRKPGPPPNSHDDRSTARPPFKWWAIDKYKQELKLTNEQSAQIEKIFQGSMEQLRADKDQLDRAQNVFSKLMEKPSASEREFASAVGQLELARYNVSKERTMLLVRIHNILTPDQRKGLEAIRKRNEGDKDHQH